MRRLMIAAIAAMMSASAVADRPQQAGEFERHGAQSSIIVALGGLTCNTTLGPGTFSARSWSWGASNSGSTTTGGGGSSGKTAVSNLLLKKEFDACSPALFGAAASGKHFATLNLTQQDANGNAVVTVRLTDVLVTAWNIGGAVNDSTPDESVSFTFRKVCLSSSNANSLCFDVASQQTS